jgi:hypothetical protein
MTRTRAGPFGSFSFEDIGTDSYKRPIFCLKSQITLPRLTGIKMMIRLRHRSRFGVRRASPKNNDGEGMT